MTDNRFVITLEDLEQLDDKPIIKMRFVHKGESEGHPFRGNQYTDEWAEVDGLLNRPDILKDFKVPKYLYHVTDASNLASIKAGGLKAGSQRTSTDAENLPMRGVYLTSSPDDLFRQGEFKIQNPVYLKIKTKGLNLRLDPEYFYYSDKSEKGVREYIASINDNMDEYAMYSRASIPASAIAKVATDLGKLGYYD